MSMLYGLWLGAGLAVFACCALNSVQPPHETSASNPKVSTYILFDGDCKEAMKLYKSALGGELILTTVGDSPMKTMFPAEMQSKIVNASLRGAGIDISASDWLRPGQKPVAGNRVCLFIQAGNPSQLKNLFAKLAVGADVTDPLRVEPFGTYGALNDRFGVRWMFQADPKE